MKIRQAKDVSPIYLFPGDSFSLTYEEVNWRGKKKVTELLTETFDEKTTIDRVAIVDLEGSELDQLGMKQAIAGVFGKRTSG